MVRRMASGEKVPHETVFLGFTRHNPAFITHVTGRDQRFESRGSGSSPRRSISRRTWRRTSATSTEDGAKATRRRGWTPGQVPVVARAKNRIDFSIMGFARDGEEAHRGRTSRTTRISPAYFQPPRVSFEVRGEVEVVTEGPPPVP
jgi:hypothetical protein